MAGWWLQKAFWSWEAAAGGWRVAAESFLELGGCRGWLEGGCRKLSGHGLFLTICLPFATFLPPSFAFAL